jgi:GH43 family beta-xylosidase
MTDPLRFMHQEEKLDAKVFAASVLFLAVLCAPLRLAAQTPYANPVIGNARNVQQELPDPFVLKWNGEYYLYVSGSPITGFHSNDLVHWDSIGPVLRASDSPDAWNQADLWAPEVVYRNGKFFMYYTASRKSDDWRVGEMARRIGVAVSDSPRGPFLDSGQPVTPGWAIDGTVFRDPRSGVEYLFYSYLYEPRLPGAGIVADRLASWNSVAGMPSNITLGSEPWEDKDGDPTNGSLRCTNEAPTVIERHGRYYLIYSGGSWDLPTYSLAYATSDSTPRGGLDGPGWHKVVPPLLRSTFLVDGPGHNALVKAPNNVDDINVYHARVVPFLDPWNRLPFVDRLYWNHDRMYMPQPTLADLSPPDLPVFATSGNGNDGHIAAEFREGKSLQVLPKVGQYTNFIYEINLRIFPNERKAVPSRGSQSGRAQAGAGAVVFQKDDRDYLRVSLDEKGIAFKGRLGGKDLSSLTHELPSESVPEAFHQVLITRNGDHVEVRLDGVNMLSGSFPFQGRRSGFGTFSEGMPVEFGYQALTPFFEDVFATPDSVQSWQQLSGAWLAEEGALHQVAGGTGRSVALKGDPAENYEADASLLWRDNDSIESKAGIVAAASEAGEMILGGFDKTIWPFARFWIQRIVNAKVLDSFSVGLPRGFQYDAYHTIRVIKQGSAFTFFLDGKEIAATRFSIASARPGLFTEGVRAAFDDVSMTHAVVAQNLVLNPGFETEQWDGIHATKDNPWILSGSARPNDCCAHSGMRRLLVAGADGTAQQLITGLTPGQYTLHAWTISTAGAEPFLAVSDFGGVPVQASAAGEQWQEVSVEFTVPADHSSAVIHFGAKARSGSSSYAAADDFYLYRK